MNTTAKTFQNTTTSTMAQTQNAFKKAKTYPKRTEGNHQVLINDIIANGSPKIWFRLQGRFVDNGQLFEDFKEMYINPEAEESEYTQQMDMLRNQINNVYFPGEDYKGRDFEMFSKLIGEEITVVVTYNGQYVNYSYLPNVEDVEQIEL